MKFLADQDVYAVTIRFLSGKGHDVASAAQWGLASASDGEMLRAAHQNERVLVTRDRDFGAMVFVQGAGPGVIYLRMTPATQDAVHSELERVLSLYSEKQLQGSFVVVEPGRHRTRRLEGESGL
jgi:predicted nuclease of predicted toxin-antitoxin system